MFQPFFDLMEKFATDFTWKRLVIFVATLMLIGIAVYLYDDQTATSQLSKYERSVAIIEKIELLKLNNVESKVVITNIYSGLKSITEQKLSPVSFITNLSTELKQALIVSFPWLLLSLFLMPKYLCHDDTPSTNMGGALFLAINVGILGYFIPIEWGSWFSFGVFPFGINLLIFIILMRYENRPEEK